MTIIKSKTRFPLALAGAAFSLFALAACPGDDALPVGQVPDGAAGNVGLPPSGGSGGTGGTSAPSNPGSGGDQTAGGVTGGTAGATGSGGTAGSPSSGGLPDAGNKPADADAGPSFTCGGAQNPASDPCAAAAPVSEATSEAGPACRCIIGVYWDGAKCASLTGCKCVSGCDRVYKDGPACESAHAACAKTPETPSSFGCGGATDTKSGPASCLPARVEVEGGAGTPQACLCLLGWVWDGGKCASLSGCKCVAGCNSVYKTESVCNQAHATCPGPGLPKSETNMPAPPDAGMR